MKQTTEVNRDKLKELVVYILNWFPDGLTEDELNYVLCRCDFESYGRIGKSITGSTYYKGLKGPINREFSGPPEQEAKL
jgi:hypothetical protein